MLVGETDAIEQIRHPPSRRRIRPGAVDEQRLHDDVCDIHARVERPIGVLEDDLNVPPPRAQRLRAESDEIVAEKFDAARCRFDQAEQHAADRRFAAAGFADQAERLA